MKKIWNYISGEGEKAPSMMQAAGYTVSIITFVHILYFVLFYASGVMLMAVLNIACICLYAGCVMNLLKRKRTYMVFNICYMEVILYSMAATFCVGNQCGFLLYMVCMMPISYYIGYSFRKEKHYIRPVYYILATAVLFILSKQAMLYINPLYEFGTPFLQNLVYTANYMMVVVAIVGFMSAFLIQIKILEKNMKERNLKLQEISKKDSLTGLHTRRSIECEYRKLKHTGCSFSVILGDIDDFKKINDTYGHTAGDMVLKKTAEAFLVSVRSDNIVCRWGGEEILVLLPSCTKENAAGAAMRIQENIQNTCFDTAQGGEICVTVTLGIADSSEGSSLEDTVHYADMRLYKGKKNGKDCIVSD